MLTQIVTFLIFFSIVGCILYGRRLIKTEKVDAVFGNPERALGGTHWVIVGSSFLLLIWLYYSWDIAKGFYPKSANELCQVGKVNDSLLGLKYQFPIEERELKSTSQIKKENKNLKKITIEIQNSDTINDQYKTILINFINKTDQLIPLLTNDDLLENETKQKISDITGQNTIVMPNAATMPQGSSAVNAPATMKKQKVVKAGTKKPVTASLVLLASSSFSCFR